MLVFFPQKLKQMSSYQEVYSSNNLGDKLEERGHLQLTGYFLMKPQALWVTAINLLQLKQSLMGW